MKNLLRTNIYDCSDEIIIIGSCLKNMQPTAFEILKNMNMQMFDLCLEETHLNMAITKILGMIRAKKIKKIIFASVDKSPHCVQMHYIQDEIFKLGFTNILIENYVAVEDKLIKIDKKVISLSKNLSLLAEMQNKEKIEEQCIVFTLKLKKIEADKAILKTNFVCYIFHK